MEFKYSLKNIDEFVKKIKPFLKNKLIFFEGDLTSSPLLKLNLRSKECEPKEDSI